MIQSRDQATMAHQESKKRKGNTDIDNNDSEPAESGVFTTFVDLTSQYKCQDFNDIAQCFITLHQNISKDFTSITTKLSDVKAELQDVKEGVEGNAQDIECLKAENETLKAELVNMGKSSMAKDVWSRKWNLIFRGINGQLNENTSTTEDKIRNFMKGNLGIDDSTVEKMTFAACHRLKSGPDLKKNIIVRFLRLCDRDLCLEKAFTLKRGCGYGVSQDLPPELSMQRAKLLKYREELIDEKRKKAKLAYLREHPFLILKYPGGQKEASLNYNSGKQA